MIAPLDWGLGHASRCVPLIRKYSVGNRVIIGSTPQTERLLQQYFPEHSYVRLPEYNVRYCKYLPQWLCVLLQVPRIFKVIIRERNELVRIVKEKNVEVVISDNRYGLYSTHVHSVFITHQLNIRVLLFGYLLSWLHARWLKRFDEIWIPDYVDNVLSGLLTVKKKLHSALEIKYIGPLSALEKVAGGTEIHHNMVILLSGPEPQRTQLEHSLVKAVSVLKNFSIVWVRGSEEKKLETSPGVKAFNLLSGTALASVLCNAEVVVCRSGYSTLMDLHILGKSKMVLVPTPGQPEQEYLARLWSRRRGVVVLKQQETARLAEILQNSFTP